MFYGLIMGVMFSINFMLSASRNYIFALLSYAIIAAIIVLMYRMAKRYRDVECGGYIKYWSVFNLTVLTFFFAGIISTIFKIIYTKYIDTEYLTVMFNQGIQQIEQNQSLFRALKLPMDENYYEALEKQLQPTSFAIQTIWMNVFSGVILGFILGGFIKKQPGLFDDENTTDPDVNQQ